MSENRPYNPFAAAVVNAFFAGTEKEEDMANPDAILGRFSTGINGGEEDKAPHITRLEKEQDKTTLAKELLDVAAPFVTFEDARLDTSDLIDVFIDVAERLRSSLHGTYKGHGDDSAPF